MSHYKQQIVLSGSRRQGVPLAFFFTIPGVVTVDYTFFSSSATQFFSPLLGPAANLVVIEVKKKKRFKTLKIIGIYNQDGENQHLFLSHHRQDGN